MKLCRPQQRRNLSNIENFNRQPHRCFKFINKNYKNTELSEKLHGNTNKINVDVCMYDDSMDMQRSSRERLRNYLGKYL